MSISTQIISTILRFSRRSTVHGFNHLAQSRTVYRRIFWLTVSICASLGFMINVYFLLEKFLQVPVLTYTLHDAHKFEFPDITFCQLNPLYFPPNESEVRKLMETYLDDVKDGEGPISDEIFLSRFKINQSFSHPSWSSIVNCQFKGYNCSYQDFQPIYMYPYGSCYTFNPNVINEEIYKQTKKNSSMIKADLRLIIYKSLHVPNEYSEDPHNDLNMPSGILLMIHEKNTYPFIGENVIVDGGTQVQIRITKVKHLESLGKCNPHQTMINFTMCPFANKTWEIFKVTSSSCTAKVFQDYMAEKCNCQNHEYPTPAEHEHLASCILLNDSYLNQCYGDGPAETSLNACKIDRCVHDDIRTLIAQSAFPMVEDRHTHKSWLKILSDLEAKEKQNFGISDLANKALLLNSSHPPEASISWALKNNKYDLLNYKFVNRNFMMVKIVSASDYMDEIVETEEYPVSRLVSDIGGSVGLWIGASLITIFEGFDLLIELIDAVIQIKRVKTVLKKGKQMEVNSEFTLHQPYILGGITLWENDDLDSSLIRPGKLRPPTPPFYHEMRAKCKRGIIKSHYMLSDRKISTEASTPRKKEFDNVLKPVPVYYLKSNLLFDSEKGLRLASNTNAQFPIMQSKDNSNPLTQYDYV